MMDDRPTCKGCGAVVRSAAIVFCAKIECQKAACRHYGVEYRPWSREQQARQDTEYRKRRRQAQTDRKGYGEHAGRRQLNQER